LLFNSALEYAIGWGHVIQDGLILDGTIYLLVYADDNNILVGSAVLLRKTQKL
jgi:hypothetical protein